MKKLRWGILSTANIAQEWLIPAMQESEYAEVVAVASRDLARAEAYAKECNIPSAFGSYEELLQNPGIDAIYNPMPNHLHIPWSIKAIEAGKHVLCEKPIGLDAVETQKLIDLAEQTNLVVMEAFMYRFHPQWARVQELIKSGELGAIKHVQASFTYHNTDPKNVRNMPGIGGGGIMDIGCYCISAIRLIFGKEPLRVIGNLELDPEFQTDRHASGMLDFGDGMATFNCSTQSNASQMVKIIGEKGTLWVENPFYRRDDMPSRILVQRDHENEEIIVGHHNQYLDQINAFSLAALNGQPTPTPLADALANMKVIDGIFSSAATNTWVDI